MRTERLGLCEGVGLASSFVLIWYPLAGRVLERRLVRAPLLAGKNAALSRDAAPT